MTSKAKNKGNSWERSLCEILSSVFGGSWLRVPSSGAFTGGMNVYRKDTMSAKQIGAFRGDIIPDDSMTNSVWECKSYKDFGFHMLVKEENKQLDGWIQQTVESADEGTVWFLCMKFNRIGEYILFDAAIKDKFLIKNHVVYKTFIFTDLRTFLEDNKDIIKEMSSPKN